MPYKDPIKNANLTMEETKAAVQAVIAVRNNRKAA
jgi:hypothetical protein